MSRFAALLPILLTIAASIGIADEQPESSNAPSAFFGERAGRERSVEGLELCWCPAGRFTIGSPRTERERRPDEYLGTASFLTGFWIGKYEVTQGQWRCVMRGFPAEMTAGVGEDFPIYSMNFAEAELFCERLTKLAHDSGELPESWQFRLPTEAEWEYACRAGTNTATAFGDSLSSKQANFQGQPYNGAKEGPSLGRTAPVGSYPANAWNIHDMHGNVFEWCRDWYVRFPPRGEDVDLYSAVDQATPSGNGDLSRVRRGGCWADDGWACRSAFRLRFEPARRADHIGMRVVAVQKRR